MHTARIGIIGGSGVCSIEGLTILEEKKVVTPFGNPSDTIVIGTFNTGEPLAFLPRHGRGHTILPSELPVQANMYALKSLGVEVVIAISAVGSLQEEIKPEDFVLPAQIIDRTKNRPSTFFGEGIVGHIQFSDPFCTDIQDDLAAIMDTLGYSYHREQTYVCMEGPAFSTRAESHFYRSLGAGIIGMTALPEAKLAREAEMCYGLIAMSTDYDCWREGEEDVSIEMVLQHVKNNAERVQHIIKKVSAGGIRKTNSCPCQSAAKFAIMTAPDVLPEKTKKKLDLLYGKYWNA